MDLKKAVELVIKEFPARIPIGYWEIDDSYVIATKFVESMKKTTGGTLFRVTSRGEVFGVNPFDAHVRLEDMKKF